MVYGSGHGVRSTLQRTPRISVKNKIQSQFLLVAMCSCFLQSLINNKLLKGFYILSNYVLEGSRIQIRIDKSKFDLNKLKTGFKALLF